MSDPDYPAFRRVLDEIVDSAPDSVCVIERAEGENAYILPKAAYDRLKAKADAYDAQTSETPSAEEAEEAEILKGFLEGDTY